MIEVKYESNPFLMKPRHLTLKLRIRMFHEANDFTNCNSSEDNYNRLRKSREISL